MLFHAAAIAAVLFIESCSWVNPLAAYESDKTEEMNYVKTEQKILSIDDKASIVLSEWEAQMLPLTNNMARTSFEYQTDLNERNRVEQEKAGQKLGRMTNYLHNILLKKGWLSNSTLDQVNGKNRRMFKKIAASDQGSKLSSKEIEQAEYLRIAMMTVESNAVITVQNNNETETLAITGLERLFQKNRDYEELTVAWRKYRDATGRQIRNQYLDYIQIQNKAAKLDGFKDIGDVYLRTYEDNNFKEEIKKLNDEIMPLYQHLHAYVRRKLLEKYGSSKINSTGPLPAHVFGELHAQKWSLIPDITTPYPDISPPDYDATMRQQGYTPEKMFKLADNFFQGLNMSKMTDTFWDKSVIEKPYDKQMNCHPTAYDMLKHDDYRIKMCAYITLDKLATIHHEMGHVQYYMHYKDQPLLFRHGANSGFHEAVGDTIILSFLTSTHLRKVDLLTSEDNSYEADINQLMFMALKKFVLLPYAYTLESYRWDVYSGAIKEERLNCEYWRKRLNIQGIIPPVPRTEEDFDAGAKHHVSSDVPYIRYFVAAILQFQFHESLCLKAGRYDPLDGKKLLHKCDIDRSEAAGSALSEILKLGSSQPWPEVLSQLTGSKKMKSSAILSYFKPLHDWLIEDNKKHGLTVGWNQDVSDFCTQPSSE